MVNTSSIQNSSHSGSGDMYRDILKNIGADDSKMEYLFGDTSDDDDDSLLHDEEEQVPTPPKAALRTLSTSASSDEELLHQWETEDEESDGDKSDSSAPRPVSHQKPTFKSPEWKEMLQEASLHQEELQAQLTNLQNTQRKSSPSHHQQNTQAQQSQTTSIPTKTPVGKDDNDKAIENEISSPILQEVSLRNTKLQDEWNSQQQQTAELQEKLSNLQTQFHSDQDQWKAEKNELFSPIRSPTRIPRWDPTTSKSTPSVSVSFVETPSTSQPKNSRAQSSNGSMLKKQEHASSDNSAESSLLQERDKRIRELEVQLAESKLNQAQQTNELKAVKDRLKLRDVEYSTLLLQYETEEKAWQDTKEEIESERRREKESHAKELEAANDLLQKQVELNQEQREELQQLKSSSWKDELEETQKRIKLAVAQQTEKSEEFQARIQDLEDRHEEERQTWKSRLEDYKTQLEENAAGWEQQLSAANDRYVSLEEKYLKETSEWQDLLEKDMSSAMEENGNVDSVFRVKGNAEEAKTSFGTLSPIPRDRSVQRGNDASASQDSSPRIETVPSQSMEKIDNLLDELGKMNAERDAILDEINGEGGHGDGGEATERRSASITFLSANPGTQEARAFDDGTPRPVETPETSPRNDDELNVTSDSAVLDRTLSLLHGLKDLMTNGDGAQNETAVLESLEILSELMQDQSGYQSMMSSPRRSVGDGRTSLHDTSLEISRDDSNDKLSEADHDTTWISSVKAAMDPWPALVTELKSRCEFLERDRNELARITEQIIQMERNSHRVELDAAVATAKREAGEKMHEHQQKCNRQVRMMYQSLCYRCQKKVHAMF